VMLMYVLLCKFILVTVEINIHSFIHSFTRRWISTSVDVDAFASSTATACYDLDL